MKNQNVQIIDLQDFTDLYEELTRSERTQAGGIDLVSGTHPELGQITLVVGTLSQAILVRNVCAPAQAIAAS